MSGCALSSVINTPGVPYAAQGPTNTAPSGAAIGVARYDTVTLAEDLTYNGFMGIPPDADSAPVPRLDARLALQLTLTPAAMGDAPLQYGDSVYLTMATGDTVAPPDYSCNYSVLYYHAQTLGYDRAHLAAASGLQADASDLVWQLRTQAGASSGGAIAYGDYVTLYNTQRANYIGPGAAPYPYRAQGSAADAGVFTVRGQAGDIPKQAAPPTCSDGSSPTACCAGDTQCAMSGSGLPSCQNGCQPSLDDSGCCYTCPAECATSGTDCRNAASPPPLGPTTCASDDYGCTSGQCDAGTTAQCVPSGTGYKWQCVATPHASLLTYAFWIGGALLAAATAYYVYTRYFR